MDIKSLIANIEEYGRLKHEYGAQGIDALLEEIQGYLKTLLVKLKDLPEDSGLKVKEPDDYTEIIKLRPDGPRKMWSSFDREKYADKLQGAFLARMAGCTLGAMVEFWSVEDMKAWAEYHGDAFPPVDYWSKAKNPPALRYNKSPFYAYTREGMCKVPVDDDITYTLLGLLIAEDYGINFTTGNVGEAWLKYLPYACTAEDVALKNLKAGISALEAADINNPYCQWIGAYIRSDPWAYIAPAYPQKAAELAYRDAYLSHRRNGIYGEMFFSAAQSAAFAVDNAIDAIKAGLTEIPKECSLAREVAWALDAGKYINGYKEGRQAIDEHFKGMSGVHTINNACITIFGLMIGNNDVTKVLSETVAMGLDNDCNAATAGSIIGAITGKSGVEPHWYRNFNNTVDSYITDRGEFKIDDVFKRFTRQAEIIYAGT